MLIACGGVSREYSQEKQSYLTAVFVDPDFNIFYYKCGYHYQDEPPVFRSDGTTIMYKEK